MNLEKRIENAAKALVARELPGLKKGFWIGASLGFRERWKGSARACIAAFQMDAPRVEIPTVECDDCQWWNACAEGDRCRLSGESCDRGCPGDPGTYRLTEDVEDKCGKPSKQSTSECATCARLRDLLNLANHALTIAARVSEANARLRDREEMSKLGDTLPIVIVLTVPKGWKSEAIKALRHHLRMLESNNVARMMADSARLIDLEAMKYIGSDDMGRGELEEQCGFNNALRMIGEEK